MRKDSEIFLRKLLEYRLEVKKDEFTINYKYFEGIPSIRTAVYDIIDDLKVNNCLTSQSKVTGEERNISIFLTLDGITYFDDTEMNNENKMTFYVSSGGQANIANGNAKIQSSLNNINMNIVRLELMDKIKELFCMLILILWFGIEYKSTTLICNFEMLMVINLISLLMLFILPKVIVPFFNSVKVSYQNNKYEIRSLIYFIFGLIILFIYFCLVWSYFKIQKMEEHTYILSQAVTMILAGAEIIMVLLNQLNRIEKKYKQAKYIKTI